jgi:hypothetical protein
MKAKKSILALVFLLVLVFMQGQALAGSLFYSGKTLVEMMREHEKAYADTKISEVDWVATMSYQSYIAGIHDALQDTLWNTSDNVTLMQVCAVVSSYLKNHPKEWSEPAAVLVVKALKEAFPKPKKK